MSILESRQRLVAGNVEEMVATCMMQLIHTHHVNIRSGWANIFAALQLCAASNSNSPRDAIVVEMAFSACDVVVKKVFPEHFHLLCDAFPVSVS